MTYIFYFVLRGWAWRLENYLTIIKHLNTIDVNVLDLNLRVARQFYKKISIFFYIQLLFCTRRVEDWKIINQRINSINILQFTNLHIF